ncbi:MULTISPECIES: hypothetical protein [Methylobacterium]|uniref:Transcriptional regulator n=2 Tax=Methylobacterium TaxID=407 RepID=A0A0C6FFV9_9HYPH|nr:hypothetical protein [Methylobacterium aquaticum]QRE77170.1 helix-turn-helix domain-containing protein [Methylobacterium aquaticum]BAQ45897.1 hypothetical protein Maq22A_c13405 [Methylobacterium aquaticum]
MTVDEVRERLRASIDKAGGQTAFAREHRVSTVYVHDALAGRRDPGPAILRALGLTKHTSVEYRPVEASHG